MTTESTSVSDIAILHKTKLRLSNSTMVPPIQFGIHAAQQYTLRETAEPSSVIAVAANSQPVLQGLTRYLKASRFQAVAVMASPAELVASISEIHPKVVVIEISSQSMKGFEAITAIHRVNPAIKILVLADYTMPSLIKMIFRSGAHGYLLAMPTQAAMLQALDAIGNEKNVLDKQLVYLQPILSSILTRVCVTV